jgi:transcriptional regulator with XRE-family HTH domain
LSQEQLAARAELSECTVRNLEADRVQAPRADIMRLLAEALQLSEPERRRQISEPE